MSRTTKIISVSFPRELKRDLSRVARREHRSQSEVLRDAFRYLQAARELTEFQKIGQNIAARMGIKSDDDVMKAINRA